MKTSALKKVAEAAPKPDIKMVAKIVAISPPKFEEATVRITGTAPYVQHKFAEKARRQMEEKQRQGSRAKSRKIREARNFEEDYVAAMHMTADRKPGIPAPAFRNACISACRIVGFAMTRAKMSIFIEPDGFDQDDGTPLVLIQGEPEPMGQPMAVRNESGVADLRVRPMWAPGWKASVRIKFDADQFSDQDVLNLMARAGQQVGIGEGRPDSPNSNGIGWGTWQVEGFK